MASAAPFSIRGAQFKMVTLQLKDGAPDIVIPALQTLLEQSPAFLRGSPVILGLDELPKGTQVDFAGLADGLRQLKLVPVGAAGGSASLRQASAKRSIADQYCSTWGLWTRKNRRDSRTGSTSSGRRYISLPSFWPSMKLKVPAMALVLRRQKFTWPAAYA